MPKPYGFYRGMQGTCSRCAQEVTYVADRRMCASCAAWRNAQWHIMNPGKATARGQAWRADNPEQLRAIKRNWNAANPDKVREMKRRDYEKHAEQYKERARVYGAEWRRRNADRESVKNRVRASKLSVAGRHSERDWQRTLRRFNDTCAYCPDPATTRDHVVPISRGGSNYIGNIVPACRPCNSSKHNRFLTEWGGRVMAGVS